MPNYVRCFGSCNAEGAAESWVEVEMSFMKVDGAGWRWVELDGGRWCWVSGVHGLAIPNLELNFDYMHEKTPYTMVVHGDLKPQ